MLCPAQRRVGIVPVDPDTAQNAGVVFFRAPPKVVMFLLVSFETNPTNRYPSKVPPILKPMAISCLLKPRENSEVCWIWAPNMQALDSRCVSHGCVSLASVLGNTLSVLNPRHRAPSRPPERSARGAERCLFDSNISFWAMLLELPFGEVMRSGRETLALCPANLSPSTNMKPICPPSPLRQLPLTDSLWRVPV